MKRLFFNFALFIGLVTLIMGDKAFLRDYNYYSFLILGTQSIFYLYKTNYFSSISLFYWFQLFFIVLPGVTQYSLGLVHFTNEVLLPVDFLKANTLFVFANILVHFSYRQKEISKREIQFEPRFSPYTVSLVAALIVLFYFDFDVRGLFTREYESNNVSLKLIVEKFVRVVPLISFAYVANKGNMSKLGTRFLLLIVLLINNPIGIPRYFSAMVFLTFFSFIIRD